MEGARPILDPLFLILALGIEAAAGYPARIQRALGHPVQWVGWLIARADTRLNCPGLPALARRRGVAAVATITLGAALTALAFQTLAVRTLPPLVGVIVLAAAASALLAQRSLAVHVAAVGSALQCSDIAAARLAVSRIVGRDTGALDEAGVARAAIESLAENFSDAVVAPTFWGLLFGLAGMAFYKTVNTADSMIGHRNARYEAFGWFAARLDDWINFPASRLSALLLCVAAVIGRRTQPRAALAAVRADATHHRSPNAGWPEAAMAGALGLRLAGPRMYHGSLVPDAWIGCGRTAADWHDIQDALALYRIACAVQFGLLVILAAIWRWAAIWQS